MNPTQEQLNNVTRLIAETQWYVYRIEIPYKIINATTSIDAIRELVLKLNRKERYKFSAALHEILSNNETIFMCGNSPPTIGASPTSKRKGRCER